MEVKDAVRAAKRYVADLFADESPDEIGLEETEYDNRNGEWHITIGFRRVLVGINKKPVLKGSPVIRSERSFKVIRIRNGDGEVLGVTDRTLRDAA
jgi:hypothetical protein